MQFRGTAIALALVLTITLGFGSAAQTIETNIITGPDGDTYARIGADIGELAGACGYQLSTQPSSGAFENLRAMRDRRATQLGLVNADVLEFYGIEQVRDSEAARAARGIRVVMPLYLEEVHVIARREISDLEALEGKVVAVGEPETGGNVTANLVLDIAKVSPAERVAIGGGDAIDQLVDGDVDAAILVGGAPIPLLQGTEIDAEQFHLLTINDRSLTAAYAPATIPANVYPFLTQETPTIGVRAMLIAFDFRPERNAYQAQSCALIADVAHLVLNRIDELAEDGHPKWSDIDPLDLPANWLISDCALQGVAPSYAPACPALDDANTNPAPEQSTPNALYRNRVCANMGC